MYWGQIQSNLHCFCFVFWQNEKFSSSWLMIGCKMQKKKKKRPPSLSLIYIYMLLIGVLVGRNSQAGLKVIHPAYIVTGPN